MIVLLWQAKYDRLAWAKPCRLGPASVTSGSGLPHSTIRLSMCHLLHFMVITHLLRLGGVYHLTLIVLNSSNEIKWIRSHNCAGVSIVEKNPYKWIVNTLLFFCIAQVWTPITFVITAAILIHISWSKCTAYTAMAGSYDYFIWT